MVDAHTSEQHRSGQPCSAAAGNKDWNVYRTHLERTLQNGYGMSTTITSVNSTVRASGDVTPNRRGARSREAVLDAAEGLIAEHGYEAATVAALVDEAGVPASSVYHYFGSKEGVLLAVMERGAERFFVQLPDFDRQIGSRQEHLRVVVETVGSLLDRHPDFLRILVVMAAQPSSAASSEVHRVVNRVRELALVRLREQMEIVFALEPDSASAGHLARFALAAFDGAFVAHQSNPQLTIAELLEHLPAALAAVRRQLGRAGV
jgi:AcrR family transcriptional regulator